MAKPAVGPAAALGLALLPALAARGVRGFLADNPLAAVAFSLPLALLPVLAGDPLAGAFGGLDRPPD